MKTEEVKHLLQRYFEGESTDAEERSLESYFQSGNVDQEVAEYAEFFGGIAELAAVADDPTIEEDVMNYILETENREKTRYRTMWKTVTGIAASIIVVLGGFLFFQEQQHTSTDTFKDPEKAYAYAEQTLQFVSGKYNKGLAELSNFDKLRTAKEPIKKGTEPIIEFYEGMEKVESVQ